MRVQDKATMEIPRKNYGRAESVLFVRTDTIFGKLGEFPELTKAVREGDLDTISGLCAGLYFLNASGSGRR
jgi:hypothetical protein